MNCCPYRRAFLLHCAPIRRCNGEKYESPIGDSSIVVCFSEGSCPIISYVVSQVKRLLRIRIVRYALVGGFGIPVNLLALALFLRLMGDAWYPVALALSFEISTTVNFFLNQLFTYNEQKNLNLLEWIKRALKAQVTSLSAQALTYVIAITLKYGTHMSPYLASLIGIICAFFFNFFISNRFVFRPTAPVAPVASVTPPYEPAQQAEAVR